MRSATGRLQAKQKQKQKVKLKLKTLSQLLTFKDANNMTCLAK